MLKTLEGNPLVVALEYINPIDYENIPDPIPNRLKPTGYICQDKTLPAKKYFRLTKANQRTCPSSCQEFDPFSDRGLFYFAV